MSVFIPDFILSNYKEKKFNGVLTAFTLFIDIYGFSPMTRELASHGNEGAEILSQIINDIFTPSIEVISNNGGFIASFAGDAFTAIFEVSSAEYVLRAAFEINRVFNKHGLIRTKYGVFQLISKIGLSYGNIEFSIIETKYQNLWYFRGPAIDSCAIAQQKAGKMEIIADKFFINKVSIHAITKEIDHSWFRLLPVSIEIPELPSRKIIQRDQAAENLFIPGSILDLTIEGEFRVVLSCFIGVSENKGFKKHIIQVLKNSQAYGGYFNRITFGDKGCVILVLFGAPTGMERLYERACDFALSLKDIDGFQFRAGITAGEAFAGFIGSNVSREYTALGDKVNLAARLMMETGDNCISTDKLIAEKLKENYKFLYQGLKHYKGFNDGVDTWILENKLEGRRKISYPGMFIGRTKQINQMRALISPVIEGRFGGIVYIDGPPGIGKSRFIENYMNICDEKEINFQYLFCDEILKRPFNPFETFFGSFFKQDKAKDMEQNKAVFSDIYSEIIKKTKDSEIKEELIREESIIGALLGLEWKDSIFSQLDGKRRYEATLYAVKNFIKGLSEHKPLVLIFDDAHWIDNESIDLLKVLITNVDNFPFIILCLCRPYDDGSKFSLFSSEDRDFEINRLDLTALDREEFSRLLSDRLGMEKLPELTINFIWDKSFGNPFFAEQIVLYLRDNSLFDSKYIIKDEARELPSNISQIIIARIDRLSARMKDTIKTASVLGIKFALEVLRRMLSAEKILNIDEHLNNGCTENIWESISELDYIFKHALIRDAVYNIQLKKRLRMLHNLAGNLIEEIYRDNQKEHYDELADHYEKAENHEKTVKYLYEAGKYAMESFRNAHAINQFNRLLDLIQHSRDKDHIRTMAETLSHIGKIYKLTGKWDYAEINLRKSLNISEGSDSMLMTAQIMQILSDILILKRNFEEAEKILRRALDISEEIEYRTGIISGINSMGTIQFYKGNYSEAMAFYQKASQIFEKHGDENLINRANSNIATTYAAQGNYDRAMEYYEKQIKDFRKTKNKLGIAHIIYSMGIIHYLRDDYPKAMECLSQALSMSLETGDRRGVMLAEGNIGNIYWKQGENKKALLHYNNQLHICKEIGDSLGISHAMANLGNVYYDLGEIENAIKCYEKDRLISEKIGDMAGISRSIGNMGGLYITIGEFDKAMECLSKMISISESIGDKRVTAIALNKIAGVNEKLGNFDKALDYYDKAIKLSKELNSNYMLCVNLLEKTQTLFSMDKNKEAKKVSKELFQTAKDIKKTEIIFGCRLLKHKTEKNIKALSEMLSEKDITKEQEAHIYYELYQLEKKEEYKNSAIDLYKSLYENIPKYEYKVKLRELI